MASSISSRLRLETRPLTDLRCIRLETPPRQLETTDLRRPPPSQVGDDSRLRPPASRDGVASRRARRRSRDAISFKTPTEPTRDGGGATVVGPRARRAERRAGVARAHNDECVSAHDGRSKSRLARRKSRSRLGECIIPAMRLLKRPSWAAVGSFMSRCTVRLDGVTSRRHARAACWSYQHSDRGVPRRAECDLLRRRATMRNESTRNHIVRRHGVDDLAFLVVARM